jgi:cell division septal protein FtsQ
MPVAAPADKRFRRAHVKHARKRAWPPSWRTLVPASLVALAVAFGVYRAADLAIAAEALTINRITVHGTSRMSPGEVLALLEGLRGTSMVTADLEGWRQKLLGSPWVADAAIRRVFPGTVSVVVSERQPLGIGQLGDALYLIDQRGMIIDEFGPNYAEFDLPIINGLAAAPSEGGSMIDDGRAALAGRLLAELQRRPDLARRISQIDVTDRRDAVVILKDDTAMIRVGDERFVERVQAYLDLAPRLKEQVPRIDYVDLRFDERVYVRPQRSGLDR